MNNDTFLDDLVDAFTTDVREFGGAKQRQTRTVFGGGKNAHPTKSGPGRKAPDTKKGPNPRKTLSTCRSHGGR